MILATVRRREQRLLRKVIRFDRPQRPEVTRRQPRAAESQKQGVEDPVRQMFDVKRARLELEG